MIKSFEEALRVLRAQAALKAEAQPVVTEILAILDKFDVETEVGLHALAMTAASAMVNMEATEEQASTFSSLYMSYFRQLAPIVRAQRKEKEG